MPLYPRPLPGLRDARRKAGLTQQALAVLAGMSVSAVARIEQGTNEARVGTAVRLAEVLNVTVEALTGGVPAVAPRRRRRAASLGVIQVEPQEEEAKAS